MGGEQEFRNFLISYTAADVVRARWINEVLQGNGYTTFFQDDDFTPGDNRPAWIEQVITHSQRTIAVLSPAYLNSKYGAAEWQFAWDEDPDGRQGKLIVVKVADCVPPGMLRLRPGIDLAGFTDEEQFKRTLISKIEDMTRRGMRAGRFPPVGGNEVTASPGPQIHADELGRHFDRLAEAVHPGLGTPGSAAGWQGFLDRRDELDKVFNGLDSWFGPHFWLVTSPPGVGKTTFLARLAEMADEMTARRWVTKTVDLRAAVDGVADALALVGMIFAVELSAEPAEVLRAAARKIIRADRPYLCLLDSAELLPLGTIAALRGHLSQIYQLVQARSDPQVRLAFVAASRRDDGWRGVTPSPRLSVLALAEFDTDAVQEGGSELAARMGLHHSPEVLRYEAALVHDVTEGVPALVHRGLQWICAEEGLQIERLNHPEVFDEIIRPFIEGQLLARDSVLPGDTGPSETSDMRLRIMEQVIKFLVPYRFFTLSHLRRLSGDASFAAGLEKARWSSNEVWQAIGGCSLLVRPLDEPWQNFNPAIRRLLFRYFYTRLERAEAHRDARAITEQWSAKQGGREQVIGLIDCIWHEAARLRLTGIAQMGEDLIQYARERTRTIGESGVYTAIELRAYAAERMRNDDELRGEVVDIDGLFERLLMIIEGTSAHGGMT